MKAVVGERQQGVFRFTMDGAPVSPLSARVMAILDVRLGLLAAPYVRV